MRRILTGLIVAAVSSTGLVTASPSTAEPTVDDQARAGKQARVVLAPKMVKKLRKANIDPAAIKPAKAVQVKGHPAVKFPVAKRTKKIVKLRGGLGFVKNNKKAKVTKLKGNYKKGRVSALINGSKRKYVFNARKSQRPKLGKIRLVLTRYAAGSMNATFNTKRFDRGDTFGYAKVRR